MNDGAGTKILFALCFCLIDELLRSHEINFYAAVLRLTGGSAVVGHGVFFAQTLHLFNLGGASAILHEVVEDAVGTVERESLILSHRLFGRNTTPRSVVGVAHDGHVHIGVGGQHLSRKLVERRFCRRREGGVAGGEEDAAVEGHFDILHAIGAFEECGFSIFHGSSGLL